MTPHGRDGRININTADFLVLGSLSDQIQPDMVEALLEYRDMEGADLENPLWYKSVSGFPSFIDIPPEIITTKSSYFEIFAEVFMEKMRKKVHGIVARRGAGSNTEVVSWKTE